MMHGKKKHQIMTI